MSLIDIKTGYVNDPILLLVKGKAVRDPTGSGNKKASKWLFLPIAVMIVGVIVASFFLHKPAEVSYDKQMERYFRSEGLNIYHKEIGVDPYGGRTWADESYWWYIGTDWERPDSYNIDDAVWCGVYTDEEMFEMISSGFSEDGSQLCVASVYGDRWISINPSPDIRVYSDDQAILYYRGGNQEIYRVLEERFGEPIADGRKMAENLSSDA